MSFYQNPFTADFNGNLILGDRSYVQTFRVLGNKGRGDQKVVAWKSGPYNLSGNDADGNPLKNLTIAYALDFSQQGVKSGTNFKNWASVVVDLTTTAASISAVQPFEIISALQANVNFSNLFGAVLSVWAGNNNSQMVNIYQKTALPNKSNDINRLHFYIVTGGAEQALQFNARSGVAELPTYFDRHTIVNAFNFSDSVGMLIYLNPSIATQAAVIDAAADYMGKSLGYSHSTVQADWQLLEGRSGLFQFTKNSGASTSSTATSIIYSAGSKVGDLALKVVTDYDGSTPPNILRKFEMPYTLTSGDLITPD